MTVQAMASALPGGYRDQVARREEFERRRPDAQFSHHAPMWTGSIFVGARRRYVTRDDLRLLLDGLDRLAGLDAARRAVEGDHPGWRVWLSDEFRWWAVRCGPAAQVPRGASLTVAGDDEAALRERLRAEERLEEGGSPEAAILLDRYAG